jgi:membrane protein required for colicin V production
MSIIDIICLIPLGLFLYKGYQRGLIIELFSLIALLIAIVGSLKLSHAFISLFEKNLIDHVWIPYIAYVLVFIALYFLVLSLGKLMEKVLKTAHLNFFNRIGGAFFGTAKALILISLFFWVSDQVGIPTQDVLQKSLAYKHTKALGPMIMQGMHHSIPVGKSVVNEIEIFFSQIADKITN